MSERFEYSSEEEKAVRRLIGELGAPIRSHLLAHVNKPNGVFMALNALASVAAVVLAGTGPDQIAIDFLYEAISSNIRTIQGSDNLSS